MVGLVQGAVAILVAFTIAAVAFAPMLSLSDAYALNGLGQRGRAYGPVRLWGSVAFIVANVGAGTLLGVIDPVHLIWLIVAALVVTTLAAINLDSLDASLTPADQPQASPRPAVEQSGVPRGRRGGKPDARQPRALLRLLDDGMARRRHQRNHHRRAVGDRRAGRDRAVCVLGAAGDRPDDAADDRRGGRHPALGRDGVRSADCVLLPLQLLHAASFGAAHLGAMGFLARAVPRELAATAQGLVATVSGIVMASATGLSGLIYAASGSFAYLAMAAMGLAGLVCALMAHNLLRRN